MKRADFIKRMGVAGVGLAFLPQLLAACKKEEIKVAFQGKVIIIGGGAAGMFAAYTLQHFGIDFVLLEASGQLGGRVKKTDDFADFPIDLGAEWIHAGTDIFSQLLKYGNQEGEIDVLPYNPETVYLGKDGNLTEMDFGSVIYGENKFSKSTWYDFFADFVIPSIQDKVVLNAPVAGINYEGDEVVVTTESGAVYTADKTVVTVPIKILQSELISFTPELPQERKDAINAISMPDGIKVFVEFSEGFFPDILLMDSIAQASGEKIYYNAGFKKESNRHILGLFTVNEPSSAFTNLETNEEIIAKVLAELDELYDGKASETYINHVIQNWSKEPYIGGSYTHGADDFWTKQQLLKTPLNEKIYFAGETFSNENWATVHGAAESGTEAAEEILKG